MRRNPLDPYAFDNEARPFFVQGRATSRDAHVGVHTATEELQAAVYAVQRAMLDGTVAVIFHLDVSGLTPLPDRDAMIEGETSIYDTIFHDDAVREAYEERDEDALIEALDEARNYYEAESEAPPTEWVEAANAEYDRGKQYRFFAALLSLSGDDLFAALDALSERGALRADIAMAIAAQQRYMTQIGLDRVVQIDIMRPIRPKFWDYGDRSETGEDYPPDDDSLPQIFTDEDAFESSLMPDVVTVYVAPAGRKARIEYHGTDLARARAAFPELAQVLVNPFPYVQEKVDEEPSIFVTPQYLIEAEARRRVGVGIFIIAQDTERVLLGERSWAVNEPGQWAGFGGLANFGESLEGAALRELQEETGYTGPVDLIDLDEGLFIGMVPSEFPPVLNWETERARWFTLSEAQELEPKHWGTETFLHQFTRGL